MKGDKIKITDFGMGRIIENVEKKQMLTRNGSPAYASPQVFFEGKYSNKTDIYSLGVIFHLLIYGQFHFKAST
jgi:serine/threonine protein kinase